MIKVLSMRATAIFCALLLITLSTTTLSAQTDPACMAAPEIVCPPNVEGCTTMDTSIGNTGTATAVPGIGCLATTIPIITFTDIVTTTATGTTIQRVWRAEYDAADVTEFAMENLWAECNQFIFLEACATPAIPTLGQWGIFSLGLLCMIFGTVVIKNRAIVAS